MFDAATRLLARIDIVDIISRFIPVNKKVITMLHFVLFMMTLIHHYQLVLINRFLNVLSVARVEMLLTL